MDDRECRNICDLLEKLCLQISSLSEEDKSRYPAIATKAREYMANLLLANPKGITNKYLPKYILQLCGLKLKDYPENSNVYKCFLLLKDKYLKLIYNKHKEEVDTYANDKITRLKNGESVRINQYETILGKTHVVKNTSDNKVSSKKIRLSEVRRKIIVQHCATLSAFPNNYLWEFDDVD